MSPKPSTRAWLFFGALVVLSALIVRHDLDRFLPGHLATEVGHNREALGFAILMCATIQWFRPWAARTRHAMPLAVGYGLGLVAFGWWLLQSDLPTDYTTFSESFFGAGVLAIYVQPRRPLRYGPWFSAVVLAFIVVFFKTPLVLDESENLLMTMLGPVAFDLFDRTILDRDAEDRPRLRLAWCAALVLAWFVFWRLAALVRPDLSGPVDFGIDYAYRGAEAYWGILLVHVYFSYVLGRSWRGPVRASAGRRAMVDA
ncbi:MAG TPA: hypothetical protein VFJ94_10250 [Intrasporangium sp.]|uniref:hypothetical protein n=1 Tax=Intrasporangium sp. TaxID=1925024 RepID=UPI002D78459D|nr:hypothetical protein [Intrasporangium sp.]HET7398890.1 hypothetical protein [Intrasporangium sp.]